MNLLSQNSTTMSRYDILFLRRVLRQLARLIALFLKRSETLSQQTNDFERTHLRTPYLDNVPFSKVCSFILQMPIIYHKAER
jgi:hypothetical protein